MDVRLHKMYERAAKKVNQMPSNIKVWDVNFQFFVGVEGVGKPIQIIILLCAVSSWIFVRSRLNAKNKNKNLDICIAEEIMADLNANANANGFNGKVNVKEMWERGEAKREDTKILRWLQFRKRCGTLKMPSK